MKIIKKIVKGIKHPKKVIRKIDRVLLGGKISAMQQARKDREQAKLEKYKAEHAEDYYDKQVAASLKMGADMGVNEFAVKDILLAQFHDGEGAFHDIAVRLLAIEQFYGKNSIGYNLYSKMQERHFEYGTFWLERLKRLLQAYEAKEDGVYAPIDVDERLHIIDGANRLAIALYEDQEFMLVRVHNTKIDRVCGYNYIRELNFTDEESKLIHEKAIELFKRCKYPYVGIIWPPAYHLRDAIENEINTYLQSSQYPPLQTAGIQVVESVDLMFDRLDFEGFVYGMYYADGMDDALLKWKIYTVSTGVRGGSDKYPVRVLYLNVNHPGMRKNEGCLLARSELITQVKSVIRNRYKDKMDYIYDNLLHVSDNYKQSMLCDMVLTADKDVSGLMKELNERFEYVIIKSGGRQSKDFPKSCYYHADVDILVHAEDVKKVGDAVEQWMEKKYGNGRQRGWTISRTETDGEVLIWSLIYGYEFFVGHIQTTNHFGMTNEFNEECLSNRELDTQHGFYVLPPRYDIMFRAAEAVHAPHKVWHREYVVAHKDEYDEKLSERACGSNMEQLQAIKELIMSLNQ